MSSSALFDFDLDKIQEIINEFEQGYVSEDQKQIIAEIGVVLQKATGLAMQITLGFMNLTILSWQEENKIELKEVTFFTPDDREKVVSILADKFKFILRGYLVKPEQWQRLNDGIDQAFENYRLKWKYR